MVTRIELILHLCLKNLIKNAVIIEKKGIL